MHRVHMRMHMRCMYCVSVCPTTHPHVHIPLTRPGGDDFLARLAQVEKGDSKAGDEKSENVAAPLDNIIKSAMDGAGGFIANFLGMGGPGAGGGKEKELTKKAALYEGPKVDYALHMHDTMHASSGDVRWCSHNYLLRHPLRSPMEPLTPRPRWSCR
jgi:ferredoxin